MIIEKVLGILKHDLEVMKDRPKCPVVDPEDTEGEIWLQGYEKALDDFMELVEEVLQSGQITWLTPYDDRVNPSSLDEESWEKLKKMDIEPVPQRPKGEISSQLCESVEEALDLANQRLNKEENGGRPG